jgi:hypothetical protein
VTKDSWCSTTTAVDGSGWRRLDATGPLDTFVADTNRLQLTGLDGGALVLSGDLFNYFAGVGFLDDGVLSPQLRCYDCLSVATDDRVYSVLDDSQLARFAEGRWTVLTDLPSDYWIGGLWANREVVVVVGYEGTFLLVDPETGTIETPPDVPQTSFTEVWGRAADDLWVATWEHELVHYDGTNWEAYPTTVRNNTGGRIHSLWGGADYLYFTTNCEFGRFDGSEVEILVPCNEDLWFYALWGLADDELFLAASYSPWEDYACGGAIALWFDGHELHSF